MMSQTIHFSHRPARIICRFTAALLCAVFLSACQTTAPVEEPSTVYHPEIELTDSLAQIDLGATVDPVSTETSGNEKMNNLWYYIASQPGLELVDHPQVTAQFNWYRKHPKYFERVAKRARPFLFFIVEELERENMPLELALLPIVESAFDPFAFSHGSASGMWQFISGTGTRYGMDQNWWYDGRRDIIASTAGAIAYLKYLHDFFDGDWQHALAAYNSGEGRVQRAIRNNKKAGLPTDYFSLKLPKETRAYVPKLMALIKLLREADKYDFAWPPIPNEPVITSVEIDSQIDLALAAKFAGLSLSEFHALNPGYNRWATHPDGPHRFIVPINKLVEFTNAVAQTPKSERLKWVRHQIKNGESLGTIAVRYRTKIEILKEINQLTNYQIYAGQYLLVPVALKELDEYSLSQTQRLAKAANPSTHTKVTHTVKSGDSLWKIAKKYDVSINQLVKWNRLNRKKSLTIGQQMNIWLPSNEKSGILRQITYTVKKGDSLARIGKKFAVRITEISKWNQLDTRRYLQPGQKLKLWVDVTRAGSY